MELSTFLHILCVALLLNARTVLTDDGRCQISMGTKYDHFYNTLTVYCEVNFLNQPGMSGLEALVPLQDNQELMRLFLSPNQSMIPHMSYNIRSLDWTDYLSIRNEAPSRFGVNLPQSCKNELDFQCYCQLNTNPMKTFVQTTPLKVRGLRPEQLLNVELTTTTPLQELWDRGIVDGTFLAAKCLATEDIDSQGVMSWVIHREGKSPEEVKPEDYRVVLVKKTEVPRAENPQTLENLWKSRCSVRYWSSTINFLVDDDDGSVSLECVLNNATEYTDAVAAIVDKSAKTNPIRVQVPVKATSIMVEWHSREVLVCRSNAYPAPTIVWADGANPSKELNRSVGSHECYLQLGAMGTSWNLDGGDFFYCNVSNTLADESYTASVKFPDGYYNKRPQSIGLIETPIEEPNKKNSATSVLNLILSVCSVVGVAMTIYALLAEQRRTLAYNLRQEWHWPGQEGGTANSSARGSLLSESAGESAPAVSRSHSLTGVTRFRGRDY